MPVLRLAIPTPLRTLFDYLPPEDGESGRLESGARLQVPFGKRELTACLVEQVEDSELDPKALKRASQVLDQHSLLSAGILQLCAWAASYYQHSAGDALCQTLPTLLRKGEPLIGNSETRWAGRWIYTPRGYRQAEDN